ncbi:MAG TPA: M56 family metallopeptidase [Bryobacteraceae bacterium]|nr:M56 family metallopeptidase [Bryobacteraceae bacterium]
MTIPFLLEWAIRSSVLIFSGAFLLWALRVRSSTIRLAAWTAMLFGSLAIPLMTSTLPGLAIKTTRRVGAPAVSNDPIGTVTTGAPPPVAINKRFDWIQAAIFIYAAVCATLLLRLCVGLAVSYRLLKASRETDRITEGVEIRESDRVAAPVTLGIIRPVIVLPRDWHDWDGGKLGAILEHEWSHIVRHDPAVQLLSAIHRALLWHSPLSWLLHERIVRTAEEASDDAALAVTPDRASYAEVLLEFMQRGIRGTNWMGVPMARYGRADQRILRILDGKTLSSGVTRWTVAAIVALGSPIAYVVATARPQSPPAAPAVQMRPVVQPQPTSQNDGFLRGLGAVTAYTVTVKPRIDGQLVSLSFKEGDFVQQGQVLAEIDPRPYQLQLEQAEGQLVREQAVIGNEFMERGGSKGFEANLKTLRAQVEEAKLRLSYATIVAPIPGVVGLRMVGPGNMVHASDSTGIVVINQLQPIGVVFTVPEDKLQVVLTRIRTTPSVPVEAWNRENSARIASGRLTAVDNQIDEQTGTVKLKATFDNKNGALYPNQFVNVRLMGIN